MYTRCYAVMYFSCAKKYWKMNCDYRISLNGFTQSNISMRVPIENGLL